MTQCCEAKEKQVFLWKWRTQTAKFQNNWVWQVARLLWQCYCCCVDLSIKDFVCEDFESGNLCPHQEQVCTFEELLETVWVIKVGEFIFSENRIQRLQFNALFRHCCWKFFKWRHLWRLCHWRWLVLEMLVLEELTLMLAKIMLELKSQSSYVEIESWHRIRLECWGRCMKFCCDRCGEISSHASIGHLDPGDMCVGNRTQVLSLETLSQHFWSTLTSQISVLKESLMTQNLMIQRNSIKMVKILMKWTSKLMGLSFEMLSQVMWELKDSSQKMLNQGRHNCGKRNTWIWLWRNRVWRTEHVPAWDLNLVLKLFLISADQHVNNTNSFSKKNFVTHWLIWFWDFLVSIFHLNSQKILHSKLSQVKMWVKRNRRNLFPKQWSNQRKRTQVKWTIFDLVFVLVCWKWTVSTGLTVLQLLTRTCCCWCFDWLRQGIGWLVD